MAKKLTDAIIDFEEQYPPLEDAPWDKPWFEEPKLTKEVAHKLLSDPEAMREYVMKRSRLPFQEVLARMLRAEPSPEVMREYARINPEKWVKMVRDAAVLAGYKEGIEIDANLNLQVAGMSDAEIMQRLSQYSHDLGDVIPGICQEVQPITETTLIHEEFVVGQGCLGDPPPEGENPDGGEAELLAALLSENPEIQ